MQKENENPKPVEPGDLKEILADEPEDDDEEGSTDDVTLQPGVNADDPREIARYISSDLMGLYDTYSYRHAASILRNSFPDELDEIEESLRNYRITAREIATPGGNESTIVKRFTSVLRTSNWNETRIQGDLIIRVTEQGEQILAGGKRKKFTLPPKEPITISNYIDGHKIDFVKGKVALDFEWNSKDQTFDRDLYALRLFHECGIVSAAVLITRSEKLNPLFAQIPLLNKYGDVVKDDKGAPIASYRKYGASTTWIGKLLYRMNAGRHGGCPILVFAITPKIVTETTGDETI